MDWNGLELPSNYYFKDDTDSVLIYCGDCREILPSIPDKSIDLVLTDPPYGINLELSWLERINSKNPNTSQARNKSNAKIISDDGSLDLSWLFDYSRWIIFGFPYIYNPNSRGWLVWDKQVGLLKDGSTLLNPVEMASTNIWTGFRLIRCLWVGFTRNDNEYRFEHPSQKPQKVIDYCIHMNDYYVKKQSISRYIKGIFEKVGIKNIEIAKLFPSKTGGLTGCVSNWLLGFNIPTREEYQKIKAYLAGRDLLCEYDDLSNNAVDSGIILDPFLGSGTTAYCAKKLNRKCIGIEIEEKYCEISAKRCSQSVMKLEV